VKGEVTTLQQSKPKRLAALIKQRCPRCLQGSIFAGWITTREACPVCDLHYGREEGYFSGGMDLSFFLAAPVLAFIFLVLYQLLSPALTLMTTLFLSYAVFIPCAPLLFRYSRTLWLYLDWQLDPVPEVKAKPLPPLEALAWLMPTPRKPWTHDSLFALAQRLATLIDPVFDRTLARRDVEPIEGWERAAWGTERFGLLGERQLPLPGEAFRRTQSFSAYGLAREQTLILLQEYDPAAAEPRVIIRVNVTPERLAQMDRMLADTYEAIQLPAASTQEASAS
jgi:uncharacterized protein (DUF983 family)